MTNNHALLGISLEYHDILGLVGVLLTIFCYARVQWRRDYAKTIDYSLLNFTGALLVIVSLMHNWNLASFVSNILWICISLYGTYRCLKYIVRGRRAAKISSK